MSKKNVLIVGFSESSHVDVVAKIAEEHHVVGWFHPINPKSQNLISAAKIPALDTSRLSSHEGIPVDSLRLDQALIHDFRDTETTFLSITDRLAFFPLSVRRRRLAYYHWLSHWLKFLKKESINHILYSDSPHTGWDNVLFDVAKKLGISQRILERTSIAEMLIYLDDLQFNARISETFLSGATLEEATRKVPQDILASLNAEPSWIMTGAAINKPTSASLGTKLKKILGIAKSLIFKASRVENISAFHLNQIEIRYWFAQKIQFQQSNKIKKLQKNYQSLSTKNLPSEKFIFFPLHYQPERTSMPLADVFYEQYLAISMLLANMPIDYKLVIKEHPRQHSTIRVIAKNKHFRDEYDYKLWNHSAQIVFLDTSFPTEQAIRKCEAVVTLTGTSGWEALLQNKPIICFGRPWYSACKASFVVSTHEQLQAAFAEIKNYYPDKVKFEVVRFLAWISPRLFKGIFSDKFIKDESLRLVLKQNLIDQTIKTVNES